MTTPEQLRENIIDLLIDYWHQQSDEVSFVELVAPFVSNNLTDEQIHKDLFKKTKGKL